MYWNSQPKEIDVYAKEFIEERRKIIGHARRNLLKAQASQKQYYDQKCRINQVEFKVGDLVMLDTRRISLKHAAKDMGTPRASLRQERWDHSKLSKRLILMWQGLSYHKV